MSKILCIVGPTGTGKTSVAIEIAKKYPSVLISADSRQVYKGMDIVTGKDHPVDIAMYGIDVVNPDEQCSVSVWYDKVKDALSLGKLPIVVGGTGLYVKAITDGIETMSVPPNDALRAELDKLAVEELQKRLKKINADKWGAMNNSDRNNPRRLIRAIEIAYANQMTRLPADNLIAPDSLIVGLAIEEKATYEEQIRARVLSRLEAEAVAETEKLVSSYDTSLPSMTAIGYRSIQKYLKKQISMRDLVTEWTEDEMRYAKRQMTWFKKAPGITWIDPTKQDARSQVAHYVSSWYD